MGGKKIDGGSVSLRDRVNTEHRESRALEERRGCDGVYLG